MRASAAAPCVFVLFLALVTCRADVSAVIRPVPDGCSTSGSAGDGTLHLKSCQFHRQADDPHTMDLKSTGLASISPTAFDGLLLVSLDLSFNYLDETSITPALLDDQVLLERVRLDNNNIASIDEQLFLPLNRLSELYLGNNPITSLPSRPFRYNRLTRLDLSNCQLTTLPTKLFSEQGDTLMELVISGNSLSISDLSPDVMKPLKLLPDLWWRTPLGPPYSTRNVGTVESYTERPGDDIFRQKNGFEMVDLDHEPLP